MNFRSTRWLLAELPGLEARGVIDGETAERLRLHYESSAEGVGRRLVLAVCGVFGALLIGGGVILLLAHNWEHLSRAARAAIALVPLVAAQVLAGWALIRKSESTAWREGTATFLALSLAAAMALVDQTYNTGGDLESFLWRWALLLAPLPWLLNSTTVAVIFLSALSWWALAAKIGGSQVLLVWPLAAAVVPHLIHVLRTSRRGLRAANLQWALAIFLVVACGLVLEEWVPGLWIVIYCGLFALMTVVGSATRGDNEALWRRPFEAVGVGASIIFWLILSFAEAWKNIGWNHIQTGRDFDPVASWLEVLMAFALPAAVGIASVLLLDRKRHSLLFLWVFAVPVVVVVWPLVAATDAEWIGAVAFNLVLFVAGVGTIAIGVRDHRLATINLGMLVVAVLVVVRFFDSHFGFVTRGLVFIAVGIGFLISNLYLSRRLEPPEEDAP